MRSLSLEENCISHTEASNEIVVKIVKVNSLSSVYNTIPLNLKLLNCAYSMNFISWKNDIKFSPQSCLMIKYLSITVATVTLVGDEVLQRICRTADTVDFVSSLSSLSDSSSLAVVTFDSVMPLPHFNSISWATFLFPTYHKRTISLNNIGLYPTKCIPSLVQSTRKLACYGFVLTSLPSRYFQTRSEPSPEADSKMFSLKLWTTCRLVTKSVWPKQ